MAGDKLHHMYYTCRSNITCFIGNSNISVHYLSTKTTNHENVQNSSQSRDPKLAFFSETIAYYFSSLRYLYSSYPICPCPMTAVQLSQMSSFKAALKITDKDFGKR